MAANKTGALRRGVDALLIRLHLKKKPLTPTQMTENPYRRFYADRKDRST